MPRATSPSVNELLSLAPPPAARKQCAGYGADAETPHALLSMLLLPEVNYTIFRVIILSEICLALTDNVLEDR